MGTLATSFGERIAAGLRRRAVTTPSRWAMAYRVMGKPFPGAFSFHWHPWLRGMHDSTAPENSGQKSAQAGFTETMLNLAFFTNDVKGQDVLYALPNKSPDASDFSASRFDPALALSPHLKALYSDVNNVGHKRAGSANLFVRGSQSKAGFKSIPTGLIILDEVEEMNQENIPLVYERLSGQIEKMLWAISTASVSGHGINKIYVESSQEHFFFPCPSCNKLIELDFPKSIVITAESLDDPRINDTHLICYECKATLDHKKKPEFLAPGIWVPKIPSRVKEHRGFHINQLYSSTVSPLEIAKAFFKGKKDQTAEQEFYNSKLGVPHEVQGSRISDKDLDDCIGDHLSLSNVNHPDRIITMGVDQGRQIHVSICDWRLGTFRGNDVNSRALARLLAHFTVSSFEELDQLMTRFRVNYCVIDAHPERRSAFAFSQRFFGFVSLCFYGNGVNGKDIHQSSSDVGEPTITVDRTSWMDASLGRFKSSTKTISLPRDLSAEYREHLKAPVRIYRNDQNGNPVGRYVNDRPDHYAHAQTYCEIAFALAATAAGHEDITG